MELSAIQAALAERYEEGDEALGREALATVLVEEVGEVATAARGGDEGALGAEAVDVVFVALCLANLAGVEVEPELRERYLEAPLEEVSSGWEEAGREAHGVDDG